MPSVAKVPLPYRHGAEVLNQVGCVGLEYRYHTNVYEKSCHRNRFS